MKIQFRQFSGDINWSVYGGTFISKKLNNGEFDYWLAIRVTNYIDAVGEREAKEHGAVYNVELVSVSISEAQGEIQHALVCCGYDTLDPEELTDNHRLDALLSYGTYAVLWTKDGNNIKKLMQEARKEGQLAEFLYGFYMDRQQNAVGATGWDLQRGNIWGTALHHSE